MSNLVGGDHDFFNFFKGGHLQKSLGNPGLDGSFLRNLAGGGYGFLNLYI